MNKASRRLYQTYFGQLLNLSFFVLLLASCKEKGADGLAFEFEKLGAIASSHNNSNLVRTVICTENTDIRIVNLLRKSGPSIENLTFLKSMIVKGVLDEIDPLKLPNLTGVAFDSCPVDDDGITDLLGFQTLKVLTISNCKSVTNGCARTVANLSGLRELSFVNTGIDGTFLRDLPKLKNLESLHLGGFKITSQELSALQSLPNLKRLSLREMDLDDSIIVALSKFPNLDDLDLSGSSINDKSISILSKQSRLSKLTINRTSVTTMSEDSFFDFCNLRELKASGTSISEQTIIRLKEEGSRDDRKQ
jgi:Leucine-rich repeat (LRR) protein